ncbi:MAG TPA: TerB family tellurite resistance protein [Acetobacteraceae bacterium]|nr:TerB family tellurite resistance protein [Acetobacteraceae bacterium]
MGYWGKVIGGMAGFAVGGPFGAVIGAALGHAADQGALPHMNTQGLFGGTAFNPARMASMLGHRDQLFAISVVVLSAKLAKCDGVVTRAEIDVFKRQFRIPPESVRDIGRLFDQARDSAESFEPYAQTLGANFADSPGLLEDVLGALFQIARADGPLNALELDFLRRVHRRFGLDPAAWERASSGRPRFTAGGGGGSGGGGGPGAARPSSEPSAYAVLGVPRNASNEQVHAAWKRLMRENHPDSLAARGVPPEFIARANDKVARINAAWDQIKRERGM